MADELIVGNEVLVFVSPWHFSIFQLLDSDESGKVVFFCLFVVIVIYYMYADSSFFSLIFERCISIIS